MKDADRETARLKKLLAKHEAQMESLKKKIAKARKRLNAKSPRKTKTRR
jgi:hypothetical protein